jgi:hypothetical protein
MAEGGVLFMLWAAIKRDDYAKEFSDPKPEPSVTFEPSLTCEPKTSNSEKRSDSSCRHPCPHCST